MKKKEYGVLGLGKFGMAVAMTLAESGNSVIAVDMDEDRWMKQPNLSPARWWRM